MGRAEFGSDWTGMELKARRIASTMPEPNIMFLPDEAGVRQNPGVGVHTGPSTSVGARAAWFVQTADGREIVIRSEQEARERWREERLKLLETWRAEHAARKRFEAVVRRIRNELYDGNLHAVAFRQRDGRWVKIPSHVWARSNISAIFELGDLDSKWRNPNVITFSAEIGTYGSHVSVKGTALICEQELQALLGESPEQESEREAEPDGRQWPTPLKVTPNEKPELGERNELASAAPDSHSSGFPGRPPKAKHLIEQEFRRRADAGELCSSLSEEARVLLEWLEGAHPAAPLPTVKTIKNNLRGAYSREKQK